MITPESPLQVEPHLPDSGVIFSDGVEADFLATVGLAKVKTRLVVPVAQ
jgi:hypothetical protein